MGTIDRLDAALRGGKLLKPESWAEVYEPVRLNSGKTYPYGFGWSLERTPGKRGAHQHGGLWQGFTTFYIRYLDDEISVVVLTNSNSGKPVDKHLEQLSELYEHFTGFVGPAKRRKGSR